MGSDLVYGVWLEGVAAVDMGITRGPFWPHAPKVIRPNSAAAHMPLRTQVLCKRSVRGARRNFTIFIVIHYSNEMDKMIMATDGKIPEASEQNQRSYDQAVRESLALIESATDQWLDNDTIDIDCARSGGMLTLTLPNRSQIIVNAQPPLQELWLAAQSGGYHFRWKGVQSWADTKTGASFWQVLSDCIQQQSGTRVMFS
jgi:CyaY protein